MSQLENGDALSARVLPKVFADVPSAPELKKAKQKAEDFAHEAVPHAFGGQRAPVGRRVITLAASAALGAMLSATALALLLYSQGAAASGSTRASVAVLEMELASAKKDLDRERVELERLNRALVDFQMTYGEIDALRQTAIAESRKLSELLVLHPRAKSSEKYLQAVTWDAEVFRLNNYIARIRKEVAWIEGMPAEVREIPTAHK